MAIMPSIQRDMPKLQILGSKEVANHTQSLGLPHLLKTQKKNKTIYIILVKGLKF